jgi:hypothetical protein
MEINEILCKETGKIIKANKIFKVKNSEDGCVEEIVSYCNLCPHSEVNKSIEHACKNCYGAISQSKKIFKTKGVGNKSNMQIENYRNKFEVDDLGEYIKNMDADEFMQTIDKIANLNSLNWNHGQKIDDKLRAYDKPKTWKTDCQICKQKCLDNKTIPECEKAKKFLENKFGNSIEIMSEKQLLSEIPTEYICQNQAQTMYLL